VVPEPKDRAWRRAHFSHVSVRRRLKRRAEIHLNVANCSGDLLHFRLIEGFNLVTVFTGAGELRAVKLAVRFPSYPFIGAASTGTENAICAVKSQHDV
jgi:hypothetical protein